MARLEKILIVDDTASSRQLLSSMLAAAGYAVEECGDGAQALILCSQKRYCMVLLDLMMPVMDGLTACTKLRQSFSYSELPIMVITSREEFEMLPEVLRAGANDFIAQPINREVLLARVHNQLEIFASARQAERVLEIQSTMMEALPQALAVVAEDGGIVHANKSWRELCGGDGGSSFDQSIQRLYGGDFERQLRELRAEALEDSAVHIDREFTADTATASTIQVSSRPIALRRDAPLRLWLLRDVTQARQIERRMHERIRLDSVALLVKGVAHNFNNIMGGILGAAEILERYLPEGERPQRAMDLIRRGAQAAAKLTNKLALFSGLGRTTDDMQVDNLEELIGALALMAQERVGSRVTVSHSVVSGLPKVGIGVAPLIEMTNHILANAIEAIPDSGTIVIAAARDASGRNVEISIRDTGVGMSAETVSRAFEPFFTTKNLDERNSIGIGGQGLGLWNVYNLLRACDGDIAVQSALGQGTTVTIKIPLVEEAGLRV